MKSILPTITQIWREPHEFTLPAEFATLSHLPDLLLHILYRQGVRNAAEARAFMDFREYSPASPYDLPDMQNGIDRVIKAIKDGEKIGVWGDFDVDGQTATAVLVSTLRKVNANVVYHIPVRGPESHGIQLEVLQKFVQQDVSLLITCDTGISEVDSIAWAKDQGIDVVITDHHTLPNNLPNASAVINPQRLEESHPLRTLPGVGVACKFAEALLDHLGQPEFAKSLHDLAALGIIADIAELRGEARFLTQSGLDLIQKSTRPSIKAMLKAAESDPEQFTEEGISFSLAPRMNAIGRLADANPMVEFLLSDDLSLLSVTVNQLEGLNARRKLLCDQVFQGALAQIERDPNLLDHPVLVLSHPEWPAGVVGIVASRLVSLYHRPVVLLVSPEGKLLRGSARSVEGINITAAIRQQAALLSSFGGHPMAAGLSLAPQNFKQFQRDLDHSVQQELVLHPLINELQIEAWQQPNTIDLNTLQALDRLAPFGAGNPPLVFAAKELHLVSATPIGKTHEHRQVIVEDALGQNSKFIWWQGAGLPQPEGIFDLAYTARNSTYKGKPQVQLEWLDFRPSSTLPEVTVRKKFKQENIDYRSSKNPIALLEEIAKQYQPEIYQEGSGVCPLQVKSRIELSPQETLVIWSIPPSQLTLNAIINQVHPARIIWFGNTPPENEPEYFIRVAALLLKENFKNKEPILDLDQAAFKLAVNPEVMVLAIRWFSARGDIKILQQEGKSVHIESGGIPDQLQANELKSRLKKSLAEIQAYRRFYLHADLSNLLDHS